MAIHISVNTGHMFWKYRNQKIITDRYLLNYNKKMEMKKLKDDHLFIKDFISFL